MSSSDRNHEGWVFENHFRMRGLDMTRIETFTDAAFAFALTLLVVSLDMPENYQQLKGAMFGAPAFAGSFVILMLFWWGHHRFSRRFGLEDGLTVWLSCLLVFTVLVYVYPLKFVFGAFAGWLAWLTTGESFGEMQMTRSDLNGLFMIYGFGFFAMSGTIAWLNYHALCLRDKLELNALEIYDTRGEIRQWLIYGSSGLLSVVLAATFGQAIPGLPGFAYMTLPIAMPWFGIRHARGREKLIPAQILNEPAATRPPAAIPPATHAPGGADRPAATHDPRLPDDTSDRSAD